MANTRASKASTQNADEGKTLSAEEVAEAQRAAATKSAGEAESLPSASAPAVASEATAAVSDTTLTAGESTELQDKKGGFGPFTDVAPPVGAALDVLTEYGDAGAVFDFDVDDIPFTVIEGDVQVAVRTVNGRAIVEINPAGWVGPGQVFGANQIPALHKALTKVKGKLHKR